MAASKSASANTMFGLLPPSSRPTFFTLSAPLRMMCLPTSTEPVKATMSTCGVAGEVVADLAAGAGDDLEDALGQTDLLEDPAPARDW